MSLQEESSDTKETDKGASGDSEVGSATSESWRDWGNRGGDIAGGSHWRCRHGGNRGTLSADRHAGGVDRSDASARAVGDSQGGSLSDGVGNTTLDDAGGAWAVGGVLSHDISDIADGGGGVLPGGNASREGEGSEDG